MSIEHSSQTWLHRTNTTSVPNHLLPERVIIDAYSQRFQIDPNAAVASPSAPVAHTSLPHTSVHTLHTHELKNLYAIRSIIESTARDLHAAFDVRAAASPTPVASKPAASSNPYALDSETVEAFTCDTVTLFIDDLTSLFIRFGSSAVLSFLHGLKSSHLNFSILTSIDLDGLTTLVPLQSGSGTSNMQSQHTNASLHAHLTQLATTTVAIRSVATTTQKNHHTNVGGGHTGPSSIHDLAYTVQLHLVHHRPSGKVTSVLEEMDIFPFLGSVKKVHTPSVPKSTIASSIPSTAASANTSGSLAQQFGSSFSLDLTNNAKSARANAILPYQHTGQAGQTSSLDAQDEEEDLLTDEEDEDFDDPDDDLEV